MARWEPNARERLEKAALELYRERGYDQTAVADIAARAGLTERTFFRYFADKREVLFGGGTTLHDLLAGHIAAAPAALSPIALVASAVESLSPLFAERRELARARRDIVRANAALQERELIKLASLSAALAAALRLRGVPDAAATLAGEMGIALFKLSFERWLSDAEGRDLAPHVRQALAELLAVAAGGESSPPKGAPAAGRPRRPRSPRG